MFVLLDFISKNLTKKYFEKNKFESNFLSAKISCNYNINEILEIFNVMKIPLKNVCKLFKNSSIKNK